MSSIRTLTASLVVLAFLAGCGQTSDSNDAAANSLSEAVAVNGAGVKGPLLNADVSAFLLDPRQTDLKGQLVARGNTDSVAKLHLAIPADMASQGPFLIEYHGGNERGGALPVIETLQTVLTNDQLAAGTPVFATPLSTFAIAHARQIADRAGNGSDALTDGLMGNSDGSISIEEFNAGLVTAANSVKATLGLGVLDADIDLFTTSPMIAANTDTQQTIALRTSNEVFAAIVQTLKQEIADDGVIVGGSALLAALAKDFNDGTFDRQDNGLNVNELVTVDDLNAVFSTDPNTLTIPGTNRSVAQLSQVLTQETAELTPELPISQITGLAISAPVISVYEEPQPEPPTPQPTPQAPTVSFTFPAATVSIIEGQSISVVVGASDADGSITHCRLSSNGQLVRIDNSAPFAWGSGSNANDTALQNLLAGNYQLQATCTDNDGLQASASLAITVSAQPEPDPEPEPDPIAPVVSFSSPSNNAGFIQGQAIDVVVSASDADGSVQFCQLRVDGNLVGQDNAAPYQWSSSNIAALQQLSVGSHTLTASCNDDDNQLSSASITLAVTAAPIPPSVSFAAPSGSANFTEGDALNASLNVSGAINYCDLYLNSQLVRRDSQAPFVYGLGSGSSDAALMNLTAGNHQLSATCQAGNGLSNSATLSFNVDAAPEPEPEPEPELRNLAITWTTPDAREDGSNLADNEISSFEIYYYLVGADPSTGTNISVPAHSAGNLVESYQIANLALGNYYVTIAAIDSDNNVSQFADPVAIQVQ